MLNTAPKYEGSWSRETFIQTNLRKGAAKEARVNRYDSFESRGRRYVAAIRIEMSETSRWHWLSVTKSIRSRSIEMALGSVKLLKLKIEFSFAQWNHTPNHNDGPH